MGILIKGMDEIPEDGAVLVVKHDNGKAYIKHACTYGYSMELVKLPAVQPDHVADISKKVSISCSQENDLISRRGGGTQRYYRRVNAVDSAFGSD